MAPERLTLGEQKLPSLEESGVRAAGIAWMRKEDYAALVRIFDDGDMFTDGWEKWNERAERDELRLKNEGVVVLRAYMDPETFPGWCTAHRVAPDREGRLAYGAEFAHEKYGKNQS